MLDVDLYVIIKSMTQLHINLSPQFETKIKKKMTQVNEANEGSKILDEFPYIHETLIDRLFPDGRNNDPDYPFTGIHAIN